MARIIKVNDDDYRIVVESGGSITLDTGTNTGGVQITGNLSVLGTFFNITAENTIIRDNLITINDGETGLGVTANQGRAGFNIDRGTRLDANLYFDENVRRDNQSQGPNFIGAFTFVDEEDNFLSIATNNIHTNGENLYLINDGTGVVSVQGTVDYETNVIHDDHIPNKKYVDDAIAAGLADPKALDDSTIKLEVSGSTNSLALTINNVQEAYWSDQYHIVQDIKLVGSRIEPTRTGIDLILASTGTGHVQIDDTLRLKKLPFSPTGLQDSTLIYGKDAGRGGTGVFYTRTNNESGELVSARRALAFSVIF
jgi:hypothetical protein